MSKFNLRDLKIYPWLVWGLAEIFYLYRYIVEVSPAVMVSNLMHDFSANAAVLGNIAAFFLYAYAGMQIPVGVLLDRWGARRLLTIAAIFCGLGSLVFGLAHGFATAALGRLLCGLGASFTAVGGMYIAAKWLPVNRFALATGLALSFGMIGAIFGSAPLALLVSTINWRNTMFTISAGGFVIALFLWLWVRDKDKTQKKKAKSKRSVLAGLKAVIRSKQSWLLAIYGGLLFMPISIFGSLWGIPFLMHKYQSSSTSAAALITLLFVGLGVGSPFFGWLSDYIGRRKFVMYISGAGSLVSTLCVLYFPNMPQFAMTISLFGFGFFVGGSFVSYAAILENNAKEYAGSVLGFMNMLNMLGGAIGQPIVGVLLDRQWSGAMVDGIRAYSLANYQLALTLLPAVMFTSLVILPWVKETYCRRCD